MIEDPHAISTVDILSKLEVDRKVGLTELEVNTRRQIYGQNFLEHKKSPQFWKILLEQFFDPVIYILLGAVSLAFIFDEWLEGFAVLIVILITISIGFYMEWKAIRSLEALQKLAQVITKVIREGRLKIIAARQLVPGDIIKLGSGDVIPADARLIHTENLTAKEASLTGESIQVEKNIRDLSKDTPLDSRANMIFTGTIVSTGNATAVVVNTGDNTAMGQISKLTQAAHSERTPLEKKLAKLSRLLISLTLTLAILIVIIGYIQGKELLLMIKTGIALAVAAVPEGLPIVATITLASGMVKLSKKNVVIKKLEAVQTLGETTIICSDKTGTLTENRMSVHEIICEEKEYDVHDKRKSVTSEEIKKDMILKRIIETSVLCNNVITIKQDLHVDAIELALLKNAVQLGFDSSAIRNNYPKILEIPYQEANKYMATLHRDNNDYLICVKGAPEKILKYCDYILTSKGSSPFMEKENWIQKAEDIASTGLKILGFAFRHSQEKPQVNDLLDNLCFIGYMGFIDPPRSDVVEAIRTYKDAGIKVVMITGDHQATARHIAEEIGLLKSNDTASKVMNGNAILRMEMHTPEREKEMLNAVVFARMLPKQKLDMVQFYQKHNHIVGMLGDGVNDTPALKKADIGIAMGMRGTEAAKEISDVILLDDRFTSTKLAIEQGRTIFQNIRHFVMYLLSCNLAEITSVAAAALSNLPLPLLPLQILFLNMITDIFPALALGGGKGTPEIMNQPPRPPSEPILTKSMWLSTISYGLSTTMVVIGITIYSIKVMHLEPQVVNNMAFYTLVLAQLINIFNIPNRNQSFFKNEVTSNIWVWVAILFSGLLLPLAFFIPIFRSVLSLVALTPNQIITILIFSFASLIIVQVTKRLGFIN